MSDLTEFLDTEKTPLLYSSEKFAIVQKSEKEIEVRFFYAGGVSSKWFTDGAAEQLRELAEKHDDDSIEMDDKLEVRCGLEWDAEFDVRPTGVAPGA